MTLVIADTKVQADYWINKLELKDTIFVSEPEDILGHSRDVEILAVGQLRHCWPLIGALKERGFKVTIRR